MQTQEFHTIIVAAGVGNRMGTDLPKCYLTIGGQSVIARTVSVFDCMKSCASITVVIHKDHGDLARAALKDFPNVKFVVGGDTRQDSVRMGLQSLAHLSNDDIILIHDGARPFIADEMIAQLVEKISETGAASVGIPVVDSMRHAPENNVIESIVSRDKVFAMQTPQGFRAGIIRTAHNQKINATDDAELVMHTGHDVHIVLGDRRNFKITTKDDLVMAELMVNAMRITKVKTGTGYDVHAFDDAPATHIRMGGIDIPHAHKLTGHSDADVVLHAITDAIYGAIGDGDIGFHFPPSKAEHKNQDSADFLNHAMTQLLNKNGSISNIDCVIICEEPKITPHREKMRARIAEICGIVIEDVAVKATTSEQLGFTGRKEGIACHAIVTIEVPR